MKKNVMLRIASCLLVAVLLTTCMISGTFAKYVTSFEFTGDTVGADGTVTATASVAKFKITIDGADLTAGEGTVKYSIDLFDTILDTKDVPDFTKADTEYDTETDVAAGMIAPGTWGIGSGVVGSGEEGPNTLDGFSIRNESDVTVQYTISLELVNTTTTEGLEAKTYTLPIEFSLDGGVNWTGGDVTLTTETDGEGNETTTTSVSSLTGILKPGDSTNKLTLEEESEAAEGSKGTLRWRWKFTADTTDMSEEEAAAAIAARDALDTEIGMAASETVEVDGEMGAPAFSFKLHVLVEQVD